MKIEHRVLVLDDYEHRMIVRALNDLRSRQIEENRSTDDIDALLLRTIDAPKKGAIRRINAR